METLEIRGEGDLFAALERLIADEAAEREWKVEFLGWPRFEITIRGESFDGGVPTRIMPALLDLQRGVDASYARLKYGTVKRLSQEERKQTELIVRFKPGSTTFISELWPTLNNLAQQAISKMNGTEAAITILGVAAFIAGSYAFKAYLNKRLAEKNLDHEVQMSQQETERMQILARALDRSEKLQAQVTDLNSFRDTLLKRLAPEDQLVLDHQPVIDGDTARKAVRRPRVEPVEARLDGQFIILTVESGGVRGGFRLRVRNTSDHEELLVKVPEGTLTETQIETLQDGEWGKRPLTMKLNVKKVGDRVTDATLVEAGLS